MVKPINTNQLRRELKPKVLAQIIGDVLNHNIDKIEELVDKLPIEYLIDFLPWDEYKLVIEKYDDAYNLKEVDLSATQLIFTEVLT